MNATVSFLPCPTPGNMTVPFPFPSTGLEWSCLRVLCVQFFQCPDWAPSVVFSHLFHRFPCHLPGLLPHSSFGASKFVYNQPQPLQIAKGHACERPRRRLHQGAPCPPAAQLLAAVVQVHHAAPSLPPLMLLLPPLRLPAAGSRAGATPRLPAAGEGGL